MVFLASQSTEIEADGRTDAIKYMISPKQNRAASHLRVKVAAYA